MKLLDKLRNVFFEEEEIEEVEETIPIKKEKAIAKKISLPEEKVKPKEEVEEIPPVKEFIDERELIKEETSFKFPMMFEEEDFLDEDVKKNTPPTPPKQEYKPASNVVNYTERPLYETKQQTVKKQFKPSPIISPVYGILDKNYKKDEIVVKKEIRLTSKPTNKKLDIDAVRNKAYGDLTNDLLESTVKTNVNVNVNIHKEPEINIFDMSSDDTKPSVDIVTVGDAEEYFADLGLEYNVDYKDTSKERATGRRSTRDLDSMNDEEDINFVKNNNDKLEDNLFDLIESMYNKED